MVSCNKKPCRSRVFKSMEQILDAKIAETVFELGDTATAVNQSLRTTGPCWVSGRVDIEIHRIAFFAPG